MQDTLDSLFLKSSKGYSFSNIFDKIADKNNILLAYRNIKNNKGSKTKGVDGKTIKWLSRLTNEEITKIVQDKLVNYNPNKVRRVFIPKANGKTRPLGIPSILDRLIQQSVLQILDPICEAKFHKHSYGFRPIRSTNHALGRMYHLAQQAQLFYVVDVDIEGFFDNINHKKLISQIWNMGIHDKKVIKIIQKMLKAEIEGEGIPLKGTPQGGILSPLLANIALNEFDWWISSQWETMKTKHQYKPIRNMYAPLKKTKLKEVYIVRYADDFKLMCRNYSDAKRIKIASEKWLHERLQLNTSVEKTKIVDLRKQYSDFLGFKIKVHYKGKDNNGKERWGIKSNIGNKAKVKIIETIRKKVRKIQHCDEAKRKLYIMDYNSYILGIHNYYCYATHGINDFLEIQNKTRKILENRLALKKPDGKVEMPKYIEFKYGKSRQLRVAYGKYYIAPVGYMQHTKALQFKGLSPYRKKDRVLLHSSQKAVSREKIKILLDNPVLNESAEYNDNRISKFIGQSGRCAITTNMLDINYMDCHHIIPREQKGDDSYGNLALISRDMHIIIHATKSATILKYLKVDSSDRIVEKINYFRRKAGNLPINREDLFPLESGL